MIVKDSVIRECRHCLTAVWLFEKDNKPFERFVCYDCIKMGRF